MICAQVRLVNFLGPIQNSLRYGKGKWERLAASAPWDMRMEAETRVEDGPIMMATTRTHTARPASRKGNFDTDDLILNRVSTPSLSHLVHPRLTVCAIPVHKLSILGSSDGRT